MRRSLLAGGAAVLIATAVSTYISTMRAVGKKLDRDFELEFSNQIRQTPTMALLKTPVASGWDFGACTLRKSAEGMDIVYPSRTARQEFPFDTMRNSSGGERTDKMLKSATFIECVAQVETRQLCHADVRQAFATDVSGFYREYDFLKANLARSGTATSDPKFAELMEHFEKELPGLKEAQNSVDTELATAKETVDSALQGISQAGYISARDFGIFGSARAKENLKAPDANAKPCA